MPKEKQTKIRKLKRGDRLEIILTSDALFITNRTNKPGDNKGFILPGLIPIDRQFGSGIKRLGYFGSFYGNRIIVYEDISPKGINRDAPNWFVELGAIHSLKYFSKKIKGEEISISELRKQEYS